MGVISLKLNPQEIAKIVETFRASLKKSANPYLKYFIQTDGITISIYNSDKVVFQGEDAHRYAAAFMRKEVRTAGSDEVGTGDYFGPICVCAAIVEVADYPYLKELAVNDSKQIDDARIQELGPLLRQRLKHSLLILDNQKYNEVHKVSNLNAIKAKMHNQAYLNLLKKGYDIPKAAYVDQFAPPTQYFAALKEEEKVYRALNFEIEAESKYPAVAAASIIARYAFLTSLAKLAQQYDFEFLKGAGAAVDECAKSFVLKYEAAQLAKVAKIHFKNTERILKK